MIRLTLLLSALLIYSMNSEAQRRDKGNMELMPNLGYSVSFLNGDNVEELDSRSALQFGVLGDYYLNETWSIRLGLSYFGMGAEIPSNTLALNYLNIPIAANWHFGNKKQWNLHFGTAPGFLVDAQLNGQDVKDFYKSFQLAISYGIGYKFLVSDKVSINIETLGLFGLTNINENLTELNRLNAGGSINLGVAFRI